MPFAESGNKRFRTILGMARLFRLHNCDIFLPSQFGLFPPKINYVHCGHFQGSNKVQPDNTADPRNNRQEPAQSHLPVATFSQLRSQCLLERRAKAMTVRP